MIGIHNRRRAHPNDVGMAAGQQVGRRVEQTWQRVDSNVDNHQSCARTRRSSIMEYLRVGQKSHPEARFIQNRRGEFATCCLLASFPGCTVFQGTNAWIVHELRSIREKLPFLTSLNSRGVAAARRLHDRIRSRVFAETIECRLVFQGFFDERFSTHRKL